MAVILSKGVMPMTQKRCFVIGSIGSPDSPERIHADWVLNGIIKPILGERFDYDVFRADKIADPGLITVQIINAALEADLVVADLTGHNPNAFYELAIRHMAEKPVIVMIADGQKIPFDIQDYRAIQYTRETFDGLEKAKTALAEQVAAIQKDNFKPSNPITQARGHKKLASSTDSLEQFVARLTNTVSTLLQRMDNLEQMVIRSSRRPTLAEVLAGRSPTSPLASIVSVDNFDRPFSGALGLFELNQPIPLEHSALPTGPRSPSSPQPPQATPQNKKPK